MDIEGELVSIHPVQDLWAIRIYGDAGKLEVYADRVDVRVITRHRRKNGSHFIHSSLAFCISEDGSISPVSDDDGHLAVYEAKSREEALKLSRAECERVYAVRYPDPSQPDKEATA